ncbi:hypothetical protein [uncultured Hymenobacter sp.]|uniref:hypothetical protein n=1 Tax=uncultured Hymenobacter sp. TaxID=170016 RepID=UPI0035CB90C9
MRKLNRHHASRALSRQPWKGGVGIMTGLLLTGLLTAAPAAAQTGRPGSTGAPTRGKIQDAEIEIVKERVNELPEATRNFDKIKLAPPPKAEGRTTYTFPEFQRAADRLNPSVQVLSIRTEEPAPLTGNYLKLGLGNYGTLLGRVHAHETRNDRYSYGLDVRHESSRTGPVEGKNSGTRQTGIGLNGELYQGRAAFGASLDVGQERYRFYGYDPARANPEFEPDKQRFTRIATRLSARNRDPEAVLQYEAGVGFRYFRDDYAARESNLLFDGKAGYALGDAGRLTLRLETSFISDQDLPQNLSSLTVVKRSRTFGQATPAYEINGKRVALTLGATVGYSGDELNGVSRLSLNPAVRAGYTVTPEKLQVYAGLGGGIQRVTRYDLSTENPWLGQGQFVADAHRGPTIYAGFAATPVRALQVTARVTYSRDKNLYFFRNSSPRAFPTGGAATDTTRFDLVYDTAPTNLLNLHAELLYNQTDQFRLGLKADFNKYEVNSLREAYGRPAVQGSLFGTYNATEKLLLGSEFYFASATYGAGYRLVTNGLAEIPRKADAIADLNLRGDYRLISNFSIFAQANNLLGRRYERYLNYPVKGLQVIAGATYTF